MNSGQNTSRRLEEEIAYARVPPCGDQVPSFEEDVNDYQDNVNPPPLTDGDIWDAIFKMAQATTTQQQVATTRAQVMTTQANREVIP